MGKRWEWRCCMPRISDPDFLIDRKSKSTRANRFDLIVWDGALPEEEPLMGVPYGWWKSRPWCERISADGNSVCIVTAVLSHL